VIAVLRDALGDEAARELVAREAREAGLRSVGAEADRVALLTRIERLGGTAGLAAKLALSRLRRGVSTSGVAPAVVPPAVAAAPSAAPTAPAPSHSVFAVVSMLARSLGDEKARDVVAAAMAELKLSGDRLSDAEAMLVLERLASRAGVVGTVARFAKARFLLK
jgi:hypothetical protein